jgi:F-type H+-transporting ATPase subunit b
MGGHEAHIDWFVLGSTITNALLFFGFLAIKLKPHVTNGLIARRENMQKQLEEARTKQADAERRLDEYKAKLENLENEVARIVKSYESEAEADRRRLAEDTERAIQRFARETEFTISQEVKKAEKAIRDAAIASTLEAAEELLKSKITSDDRRRLADEYIRDLEKVA